MIHCFYFIFFVFIFANIGNACFFDLLLEQKRKKWYLMVHFYHKTPFFREAPINHYT